MTTQLFLAPHYDDAAYSCGGTIAQWTQQGKRVLIYTLMAGTAPAPDTPIVRENHQRWQAGGDPVQARREEDKAAAAILGATTQYADIPDCIYRTAEGEALYPTEESLWGAVHPADRAPGALQALTLPDADFVYAPLGVGGHVDHRIVRDWARGVLQKRPLSVLRFYTDYPYARDDRAIQAAREALGVPVQEETVVLTEAALTRKIQAMAAYRSQIATFWEDASAIRADVRQHFYDPQRGHFIERYWRAVE